MRSFRCTQQVCAQGDRLIFSPICRKLMYGDKTYFAYFIQLPNAIRLRSLSSTKSEIPVSFWLFSKFSSKAETCCSPHHVIVSQIHIVKHFPVCAIWIMNKTSLKNRLYLCFELHKKLCRLFLSLIQGCHCHIQECCHAKPLTDTTGITSTDHISLPVAHDTAYRRTGCCQHAKGN